MLLKFEICIESGCAGQRWRAVPVCIESPIMVRTAGSWKKRTFAYRVVEKISGMGVLRFLLMLSNPKGWLLSPFVRALSAGANSSNEWLCGVSDCAFFEVWENKDDLHL
ncbi:hypothetical protein HNY73_014733 [Argiope bruennichi]|uniref:Uncharacterized protein n=1 Tax=Argiope bruennichi TaxID=94029 RepID=A0A8T0EUD8_ARGBR|nr:hypothetical protein HNY73_014733 [Argiope bruennichi]